MAALLGAVLLLAGCRMEVTAGLELQPDGSGVASLALFLDRELLNRLDELEVDVIGEVEAVAAEVEGWDVEVTAEGAEGVRLRLEHAGSDPAGALGELSAGLVERDPGLWADLAVVRDGDAEGAREGELALSGQVRLTAPEAPGVTTASGEGPGPGAAELERLMAEHVEGELVVTMPGPVRSHDADGVTGRELRWHLPVEESVGVEARAGLSSGPGRTVVVAVAGALVLVTLVGVALVRRGRPRSGGPGL